MIRLITHQDIDAIYREVDKSRYYLQNLVWSATATTESVALFVQNLLISNTKQLYGIFHDDNFCGCVEIRHFEKHAEIGYWLGLDYRGQHILQDALKELKGLIADEHMTAKVKHNNVKSYQILHSIFNMEKTSTDDTWVYLSS